MHAFAWLGGQCVLDFVGRAEAVDEGLAELSRRIGVAVTKADDANVNKAPAGEALNYPDRYDRTTIEIVNMLYGDDFERFGYARADPASRSVRAERR